MTRISAIAAVFVALAWAGPGFASEAKAPAAAPPSAVSGSHDASEALRHQHRDDERHRHERCETHEHSHFHHVHDSHPPKQDADKQSAAAPAPVSTPLPAPASAAAPAGDGHVVGFSIACPMGKGIGGIGYNAAPTACANAIYSLKLGQALTSEAVACIESEPVFRSPYVTTECTINGYYPR